MYSLHVGAAGAERMYVVNYWFETSADIFPVSCLLIIHETRINLEAMLAFVH